MTGSSPVVTALLLVGLLALILIPFLLWEEAFFGTTRALLASGAGGALLAAGLAGLLAGDVFLPVPSSLVSTAAGARFGLAGGALVSVAGLTAGCVLGYALGRRVGRGAVIAAAGERRLARLERATARLGDGVLVACRAVPVLAEASVILAGVGRMPAARFVALTTLANLGLSLAYAGVGARAAGAGSFLLAFGGAIAIPALGMAVWRLAAGGRGAARGASGSATRTEGPGAHR